MIGSGGISPVLGGAQGEIPTWPGVYYGVVSNNNDPKKQNRCQLRIPQILGGAVTTWAVSLTPLTSPPKVGTLIAAMFVGGDLDYPCYLVVNTAMLALEGTSGNIQAVGTALAAGTSKNAAAADHVHTLANALESTGTNIHALGSQAAGTSAKAARADHVHANAVAELLGVTGALQLDSSTTGVSDVTADIYVMSKNFAGLQSEIDINAGNINITASNNFVLSPSATNDTVNISGGNTVPGTGPSSYTQTWGSEVGATIATMYNAVNKLYDTVNSIYNNLYT